MQVQALRFALLIVLTVALASVAFRIDSHSSSSPSSQPRTHVPATATPANPQTSAPSTQSSTPSSTPTHHSHPATNGGSNGGSSGGGAAAGAPEQLPVTGWDSAMKLGGLAVALIGGGWLTIRGAGPSSARRQRASVHD